MAKVIFTKEPQEFIEKLAEALKSVDEFEKPEWVDFVKSGMAKERPPMDEDFWYNRAASVLRQLYLKGVVGVGRLRIKYGSKKNRGGRPSKFYKSGGKIIRTILQQAEEAGFVEKVDRMQHGRRLTAKGRDFLDAIEIESKKEDFEEKVEEIKEEIDNEIKSEVEPENGKQKSEKQKQ